MEVPTNTVKVMALVITLLSGLLGGLVSFEVVLHLSGDSLKSLASAGGAFMSVTLLVKNAHEKLGLL
ncbi:hypothetical protein [Streptomyces sp. NPDC093248]|uniref:hypothetical protein n=1 Tax=Streptomyces sp. NPDC093248 TaxID=3155072 RepID=UPI0034440F74